MRAPLPVPEVPPGVNVFLSYTGGRNKPWVRRLAKQWRALGLKVFFDEDSVQPGEDVVTAIERGIAACDHVVLVLSPEAMTSNWVALETAMARHRDPSGTDRRLIPLLVEPMELDKIRLSLQVLNIVDLTEPERRDERYHILLRSLGIDGPDLPPAPPFDDDPAPVPVGDPGAPPCGGENGRVATDTATVPFELRIPGRLSDFTPETQQRVLAAIRELLETDRELRIRSIREGSVILTLELTPEEAERLYWAVQRGELDQFGDCTARVLDEEPPAADVDEGHEPWRESAPGQRLLLSHATGAGKTHAPILPHDHPYAGDSGGRAPLPLSFAQERLWLLHQLNPGSASLNVAAGWWLRGPLNTAALERALREIVGRHEILRTVLAEEEEGRPVQVVRPEPYSFELTRMHFSRDLVDALVHEEIGLDESPLLHARLLYLDHLNHALLLCAPAIACDGPSLELIFEELLALYPGPLKERPVRRSQYADFAAWQRRRLEGDEAERQLSWWKETLAGAPQRLGVPPDFASPGAPSDRAATERLEVPAQLASGLRRLAPLVTGADASKPPLSTLLLAGFGFLLSRYGAGPDLLIGERIRDSSQVIGPVESTLVLRIDLSGNPTLLEMTQRVHAAGIAARDHGRVPFERLLSEVRPAWMPSHAPLVQARFGFRGRMVPETIHPQLRIEPLEMEPLPSGFDLDLSVTEGAGGLWMDLQYDPARFEASTIRRMLSHLVRVMEVAVLDPHQRLSRVDLLQAYERESVVSRWNDTDRISELVPVHRDFESCARRTPQAVAVYHGGSTVTYAELDRRANRLASRLRQRGAGTETQVGVCMRPSPDLLAALLAVLKAGAACVPLDPRDPPERLGRMVDRAGVRVLLTDGTPDLPESHADLVRADEVAADPGVPMDAVGNAVPDLADLACVFFVSGTTGPRGVMLEHRAVANLFSWARDLFDVHEGDVVPAFLPPVRAVSLLQTLLPLTRGAAVRIVSAARETERYGLLEEIGDATHLIADAELLHEAARRERAAPGPDRLRLRILLANDRDQPVLEPFPWPVLSVFGAAEATVVSAAHRFSPAAGDDPRVIGRPVANVHLYVCDPYGNPQPAGVPGELWIGGAGVARGYWGRPGLTAERFVPDPFGPRPGGRLFRTRERARWLEDGTLQHLGRMDRQVFIGGFRVEPGEVEDVLLQHPAVRECVVVALDDAAGDTRLHAYAVAEAAYAVTEADAESLRAHLRLRLPEYMVPGAFAALRELPRTPAGAVDRLALEAPGSIISGHADTQPRTDVEIALAEIWKEVLGVEAVGTTDSFFALGGHSLMVIRLTARVREAFAVELPLRRIFSSPSLEAMAQEIEALVFEDLEALSEVEEAVDLTEQGT